jgi:hypothetical protein
MLDLPRGAGSSRPGVGPGVAVKGIRPAISTRVKYDRYWGQNHSERLGVRIEPYRIVNASSTGSERSR